MKIIFWMLVIAGAIMLVRRYGALAAAVPDAMPRRLLASRLQTLPLSVRPMRT